MTWKSNQLKKKDQIKNFVSTSFWPFEDVPVVIGEVTATHELWDLNGFWHGWNGQRGKTHTYLPWPWPCAHSGSTGTSQVTATYVDGNNIDGRLDLAELLDSPLAECVLTSLPTPWLPVERPDVRREDLEHSGRKQMPLKRGQRFPLYIFALGLCKKW